MLGAYDEDPYGANKPPMHPLNYLMQELNSAGDFIEELGRLSTAERRSLRADALAEMRGGE